MKTIGKSTKMWKLFERLLIELNPEEYPWRKTGITKGEAVNLAMGLNQCQRQWAEECKMPEEFLQWSAKAKEEQDGLWMLEISQRGRTKKNQRNWVDDLLNAPGTQAQVPAPAPTGKPQPKEEYAPPDRQEDIFTKWLQK